MKTRYEGLLERHVIIFVRQSVPPRANFLLRIEHDVLGRESEPVAGLRELRLALARFVASRGATRALSPASGSREPRAGVNHVRRSRPDHRAPPRLHGNKLLPEMRIPRSQGRPSERRGTAASWRSPIRTRTCERGSLPGTSGKDQRFSTLPTIGEAQDLTAAIAKYSGLPRQRAAHDEGTRSVCRPVAFLSV